MQNHYNDLKPIAEMMYPDPAVEELKAIADKMRLSERLVDMNQVRLSVPVAAPPLNLRRDMSSRSMK